MIHTGGLKREMARATIPARVGTSTRSHGTVSKCVLDQSSHAIAANESLPSVARIRVEQQSFWATDVFR